MSISAYSNSGLHHKASKGHTSTQMPQYMHSEKSIANRSRTLRARARPPRRGRDLLLVGVDVDAPVGALARAEHADVQFSSISAMTPRDRGGSLGSTSGYSAVCVWRVSVRAVVASPLTRPGRCPGWPACRGAAGAVPALPATFRVECSGPVAPSDPVERSGLVASVLIASSPLPRP